VRKLQPAHYLLVRPTARRRRPLRTPLLAVGYQPKPAMREEERRALRAKLEEAAAD